MRLVQIIGCFLLLFHVGELNGNCQNAGLEAADDRVHYGDLIDVDFVGGFEFDWRGTLNPEGFLNGLDGYKEPIYALCKSEGEISSEVERLYRSILRDPKVVVKIIDRSNRAVVRIDGAIRTPTRFRLQRKVFLRELLVQAGGLTDSASGDITIFRPKNLGCRPVSGEKSALQDNETKTQNIKITELMTGYAAANPQILSGDLITVTKALPVYVIGAVANPRPIFSPAEITVSRAIAIAGGLAKNADGGRVTILRRENGETRIIAADIDENGKDSLRDEVLKPFDIVDVAARGGSGRKYPPAVVADSAAGPGNEFPLKVID